jgi:catechol 2,3-dioxygenase-like lactoylglutathione lyase family enzyme
VSYPHVKAASLPLGPPDVDVHLERTRAELQDVWSGRSSGLNGIVATTIDAYVGGLHMSGIHHSVIAVGDLEASLRFYRDGLGLDVLQDRKVEGDWPSLFDGPSRTLHAVFLGDAHVPDVSAGVLELIDFPDSSIPTSSSDLAPTRGLFQLSFFVDVEATLKKLAGLGLGGPPRRVAQSTPNGPITIATVRDPDGVLVLLTPGSITH